MCRAQHLGNRTALHQRRTLRRPPDLLPDALDLFVAELLAQGAGLELRWLAAASLRTSGTAVTEVCEEFLPLQLLSEDEEWLGLCRLNACGKITLISDEAEMMEPSSAFEGTSLMTPRSRMVPSEAHWEASVMAPHPKGASGCGRLSITIVVKGAHADPGLQNSLEIAGLAFPLSDVRFVSSNISLKSCISAVDSVIVGTSLCRSSGPRFVKWYLE